MSSSALGAFVASIIFPYLLQSSRGAARNSSATSEGTCSAPIDERTSLKCVYYVTGHGFGHAARSVVIIQALLDAGHEVEVVSSVPIAFFAQSLPRVSVHSRRLDSGAVQLDPLTVDPLGTLENYKNEIYMNHDALLVDEVRFLRAVGAGLVLTDATPIACTAGKIAGATVAIVSNFCWDFIFEQLCSQLPHSKAQEYHDVIAQVSADYSHCDAMILYPGYNKPLGSYKILHAPLISRMAVRDKSDVREELGLSAESKLLVLGFGGHRSAWRLQDSFLPEGWACVVLAASAHEMPSARFVALAADAYVPDYVAAADCWIGKLGFGSVSEALAHGVPLVYIPRSSWPEEKYLEDYLLEEGGGIAMPAADFFEGSWGSYLEMALVMKKTFSGIRTEGAPRKIVEHIESLVRDQKKHSSC